MSETVNLCVCVCMHVCVVCVCVCVCVCIFQAESPTKFLPSTPTKSKVRGSPAKQRDKLTPSKGQTGITQFFSVDAICTARSPQKASGPGSQPGTGTASLQAPAPSATGESSVQQSAGDHQQLHQVSAEADSACCDVASSEWNDEMGEEAFADLAAGVDWDDDFDIEPDSKKMKMSS